MNIAETTGNPDRITKYLNNLCMFEEKIIWERWKKLKKMKKLNLVCTARYEWKIWCNEDNDDQKWYFESG